MRPIWPTLPSLSILATIAAVTMLPASAGGQENSEMPANPDKRFQIIQQDDFFVRLDKKTGETSLCRKVIDSLACSPSVEQRDSFHAEIAELQKKLAALREQQDAQRDITEPGKSEASPPEPKLDIPDPNSEESTGLDRDKFEQEMDKAIDITKQAMRKLFQAVKELQKEFEKEDVQ